MFGKAARQERKVKQMLAQMNNMKAGIVIPWADKTGDRLEAKITEMRNEYGEEAPADIAGPAHQAMWTYNKSTEAIDQGLFDAAVAGLEAVDAWLDGGEMIVPGADDEESQTSDS